MSNNITLEIDGIKIPIKTCLDFNQEYDKISAFSTLRTMNGTAIRQGTYTKLKTNISGSGYAPVGLSSLDVSTTHTLKCAAPLSVVGATNVIILPASRRDDINPVGYALVDDDIIETGITLVGNTATLTAVAGASSYQVVYIPELTVIIEPIKETVDIRNSSYGWNLSAEEV